MSWDDPPALVSHLCMSMVLLTSFFLFLPFSVLIPALSLFLSVCPLLHAALLSRQYFNKQSPGSKMLLNGCILLAGSEQAVYRGGLSAVTTGMLQHVETVERIGL